jgi:hypothetical protein
MEELCWAAADEREAAQGSAVGLPPRSVKRRRDLPVRCRADADEREATQSSVGLPQTSMKRRRAPPGHRRAAGDERKATQGSVRPPLTSRDMRSVGRRSRMMVGGALGRGRRRAGTLAGVGRRVWSATRRDAGQRGVAGVAGGEEVVGGGLAGVGGL